MNEIIDWAVQFLDMNKMVTKTIILCVIIRTQTYAMKRFIRRERQPPAVKWANIQFTGDCAVRKSK